MVVSVSSHAYVGFNTPRGGVLLQGNMRRIEKKNVDVACALGASEDGGDVAEHRSGGILRAQRGPLRVVLVVAALAALAAPALIVGLSAGGFGGAKAATLRLAGLYAFTLMFFSIVTGALAPRFYILFDPRRAYRFHIACGAAGFGLAVVHGTVVLVTGYFRGYNAVWVIGPVVIALMAVTIATALDHHRLPRVWRAMHQINYALFAAIFVKALVIGQDVSAPTAAARAMKAIMVLYVALAAAALLARLSERMKARARRARAADA